jgi:hypothetical protein
MLLVSLALLAHLAIPPPADCTFNGKPLFGKVRFVEDHPDVRVSIVKDHPDLLVQLVRTNLSPEQCGEWRVTKTSGVRVQIVRSHPDVRVKLVSSNPGRPR